MIVSGATLWGATGPMMEWLLENSAMTVSLILIIRLLLAGTFILLVLKMKGVSVTKPLRQKVWLRQILIFGLFGMLGVQYSFLGSIHSSNAVIATLFQFLAPIYIIIFVSFRQKMIPPIAQIVGMAITMVGLFLLLTNGSLSGFALSKEAVFWGVLVGFTFAFYTLYPVRLMNEWGVLLSVGWGMLIGGTALFILNFKSFFTNLEALVDLEAVILLAVVIVVGTLAFVLFLGSMKYISPIETSILSSFEPLTAMVISVLWFGQILGFWQLSGAIIMLVGVTGLSVIGGRAKKQVEPDSL